MYSLYSKNLGVAIFTMVAINCVALEEKLIVLDSQLNSLRNGLKEQFIFDPREKLKKKDPYDIAWEALIPPIQDLTLLKPETISSATFDETFWPRAAYVSEQGARSEMEDAEVMYTARGRVAVYGVFDGHGGYQVAVALSLLMKVLAGKIFLYPNVAEEIKKGFQVIDQKILEFIDKEIEKTKKTKATSELEHVGSTAVVALVSSDDVYVAHTGDSRAHIVGKNGKLLGKTRDHSFFNSDGTYNLTAIWEILDQNEGQIVVYRKSFPKSLPLIRFYRSEKGVLKLAEYDETKKNFQEPVQVTKAQINEFFAKSDPRLHSMRIGGVNMTRSFGDIYAKADKASVEPDVQKFKREDIWFILLTCDGIWEQLAEEPILSYVAEELKKKTSEIAIAQGIVIKAKKSDSDDNMTAMVINFAQ